MKTDTVTQTTETSDENGVVTARVTSTTEGTKTFSAAIGEDTIDATARASFGPLFDTATKFDVGNTPGHMDLGDVNGDGTLDLVVPSFEDHVAVLLPVDLGSGVLAFARLDFDVQPDPTGVTLGDFDGDGNTDIATSNSAAPSDEDVSILIGAGNGTFPMELDMDDMELPYPTFNAGMAPQGIVSGDFDGDGDIDLFTVNTAAGPGSTSILKGDGTGTFVTGTDIGVGTGPNGNCFGRC